MPDLEPVSGDPFAPQLTPVSGDPFAESQGIQNESGWMSNPTFQERWEGLPRETQQSIDELSTKEGLENFLHPKNQEMAIQYLLRNNKTPRGWVANQLPQFSPTMDRRTVAEREWETTHQNTDPRYPSLQWQQPSPYPNVSGNRPMPTPFDPDRPEVYNYMVSDESDMTHWPDQSNPVAPFVNAVTGYMRSGDYNPVHAPGTQPQDYLNELARNPDILAKNVDQASNFAFGGITRGKPITAYHGSPFDFEKFDTSKIGTGEGAQVYGHGLYFAENPQVAESYKLGPDWKWSKELANELGHGKMYQVGINAEPEHFLDWDKPLSEQSEHVKKALKGVPNIANSRTPNPTGQEIHDLADLSSRDKNGSDVLRQAGIPGIRYLDQGSRNAERRRTEDLIAQLEHGLQRETGDERARTQSILQEERAKLATLPVENDTNNYVVFNDKIIDILKKYGMAGLVAGGAYHLKTQPVGHDPFAE